MSKTQKQAAISPFIYLPLGGAAIGGLADYAIGRKTRQKAEVDSNGKKIKTPEGETDAKENARRLLRSLILGGGVGLGLATMQNGGERVLRSVYGLDKTSSAKPSKLLAKLVKQATGEENFFADPKSNYLIGGGASLLGGLALYHFLNDKKKRSLGGYLGAGLTGLGTGLAGAGLYNKSFHGNWLGVPEADKAAPTTNTSSSTPTHATTPVEEPKSDVKEAPQSRRYTVVGTDGTLQNRWVSPNGRLEPNNPLIKLDPEVEALFLNHNNSKPTNTESSGESSPVTGDNSTEEGDGDLSNLYSYLGLGSAAGIPLGFGAGLTRSLLRDKPWSYSSESLKHRGTGGRIPKVEKVKMPGLLAMGGRGVKNLATHFTPVVNLLPWQQHGNMFGDRIFGNTILPDKMRDLYVLDVPEFNGRFNTDLPEWDTWKQQNTSLDGKPMSERVQRRVYNNLVDAQKMQYLSNKYGNTPAGKVLNWFAYKLRNQALNSIPQTMWGTSLDPSVINATIQDASKRGIIPEANRGAVENLSKLYADLNNTPTDELNLKYRQAAQELFNNNPEINWKPKSLIRRFLSNVRKNSVPGNRAYTGNVVSTGNPLLDAFLNQEPKTQPKPEPKIENPVNPQPEEAPVETPKAPEVQQSATGEKVYTPEENNTYGRDYAEATSPDISVRQSTRINDAMREAAKTDSQLDRLIKSYDINSTRLDDYSGGNTRVTDQLAANERAAWEAYNDYVSQRYKPQNIVDVILNRAPKPLLTPNDTATIQRLVNERTDATVGNFLDESSNRVVNKIQRNVVHTLESQGNATLAGYVKGLSNSQFRKQFLNTRSNFDLIPSTTGNVGADLKLNSLADLLFDKGSGTSPNTTEVPKANPATGSEGRAEPIVVDTPIKPLKERLEEARRKRQEADATRNQERQQQYKQKVEAQKRYKAYSEAVDSLAGLYSDESIPKDRINTALTKLYKLVNDPASSSMSLEDFTANANAIANDVLKLQNTTSPIVKLETPDVNRPTEEASKPVETPQELSELDKWYLEEIERENAPEYQARQAETARNLAELNTYLGKDSNMFTETEKRNLIEKAQGKDFNQYLEGLVKKKGTKVPATVVEKLIDFGKKKFEKVRRGKFKA